MEGPPSTGSGRTDLPLEAAPPLDSGAASHVGRREKNEDSFLRLPELGLFAVADGLGGYEGGEVASALSVRVLEEVVSRRTREEAPESVLASAARRADQEVRARQVGPLSMMGSTLSAVLLADRAALCHIGDSRIYRLRGGRLERLTRDHTVLEELSFGGSEPTAFERARYRHVLSRALGLEDGGEAEVERLAVRPGDVLLLCSDGVHGVVPEARLAELLAEGPAWSSATRLVQEAYDRGGEDNATAVVVRLPG